MAITDGGSFAPPLTDELLDRYTHLIDDLPAESEVRDALSKLLRCCEIWWGMPESTGGNGTSNHKSGRGLIVNLDKQIARDLWEHIPWTRELDSYGELFDRLSPITEKELRNAAFHLLWHVKELDLDREPITKDKL